MSRKAQPNRSLGKMSASELFRSGLPRTRTRRQVVASFLKAAEGVAHRWIDTRKGTLLLQMAPYQPASGQIYIYDRQRDMWYMLDFEDARESFSTETFEQVYREYKLLAYVEQPGLLQNLLDHRNASVAVSVAAPGVSIAAADLDHDLEMVAFMETMNASPFADQLVA
jgi:hypothetical protein